MAPTNPSPTVRVVACQRACGRTLVRLVSVRRPGRSMGSLARALEDYFTAEGLALPTDQAERLAAGTPPAPPDAVPAPLRRQSPGSAGTCSPPGRHQDPHRSHYRDCPCHRARPGQVPGWPTGQAGLSAGGRARHRGVPVHSAQGAQTPADRAAAVLRFARGQKIILADPTRDLTATAPRGFTGQAVTLDPQRVLFRRWTTAQHHGPRSSSPLRSA